MARLPHQGETSSWHAVTRIPEIGQRSSQDSKQYVREHGTRDHSTTWLTYSRVFSSLFVRRSRKRLLDKYEEIINLYAWRQTFYYHTRRNNRALWKELISQSADREDERMRLTIDSWNERRDERCNGCWFSKFSHFFRNVFSRSCKRSSSLIKPNAENTIIWKTIAKIN